MPARRSTRTKAKKKAAPKKTTKPATKRAATKRAAKKTTARSQVKTRERRAQRQETGAPGGDKGRAEEIEPTGVYPVSEMEGADEEAVIRGQMSWGQGERGAEGYYESGKSELPTAEDEYPPPPSRRREEEEKRRREEEEREPAAERG